MIINAEREVVSEADPLDEDIAENESNGEEAGSEDADAANEATIAVALNAQPLRCLDMASMSNDEMRVYLDDLRAKRSVIVGIREAERLEKEAKRAKAREVHACAWAGCKVAKATVMIAVSWNDVEHTVPALDVLSDPSGNTELWLEWYCKRHGAIVESWNQEPQQTKPKKTKDKSEANASDLIEQLGTLIDQAGELLKEGGSKGEELVKIMNKIEKLKARLS